MRGRLFGPLVLIFAVTGIACACPSWAGAVDTVPHHQHDEQFDAASDCHELDCERHCDVVPAGKSVYKYGDHSLVALQAQAGLVRLLEPTEIIRAPPDSFPLSTSNPVTLKVRMLD